MRNVPLVDSTTKTRARQSILVHASIVAVGVALLSLLGDRGLNFQEYPWQAICFGIAAAASLAQLIIEVRTARRVSWLIGWGTFASGLALMSAAATMQQPVWALSVGVALLATAFVAVVISIRRP